MNKHVKLAASAVLAASLSTAASATDWWLVAKSGAKPQRQSFYVDLRSINPTVDVQALKNGQLVQVHQIDTRLVLEAGAQTQEIARSYLVDCDKARVAVAKGAEIGRDGVALAELPKTWEAVSAGSPSAPLHEFVCESLGKQSSAGKPARDIAATASLAPMEHAWAKLWPDAQALPALQPSPQREALARQRADNLQAHLRQQDAQYLQGNNSAAFEKAAKEAKQSRSALPEHEAWVGATEAQLVAEMGMPSEFSVRNGTRFFVYASSYERNAVYAYYGWFSRGLIVTPETLWCRTTYMATQGRVFDYKIDGNDCQ
jgi:hypothetical protein